jgi:hypothetical protein
MMRDLHTLDDAIEEYRSELQRAEIPEKYAHLGTRGGRMHPKAASMLSPTWFSDEQMRGAYDRTRRGESAVLESRDFSTAVGDLPAQLFAIPTFPRHEARLADRLPGFALDAPSLEYVQVNSVTGAAGVVGEGQPKPEAKFPVTPKITTAKKLAVHGGISWENVVDYDAFVTAVRTELMRLVIDLENHELVYGDATASHLDGMLAASGILTFTATGVGPNNEHFTDIAGAISTLRTGPALATPDLLLLHPNTWASLRTEQDQMGRFYVSADPSLAQVDSIWGVDVLQSTAFTPGDGVLLDTTLVGRVAVREALTVRLGYSGTDFTDNVVRTVVEERLNLAVERPAAICHITGLPATAPAVTETTKSSRK